MAVLGFLTFICRVSDGVGLFGCSESDMSGLEGVGPGGSGVLSFLGNTGATKKTFK